MRRLCLESGFLVAAASSRSGAQEVVEARRSLRLLLPHQLVQRRPNRGSRISSTFPDAFDDRLTRPCPRPFGVHVLLFPFRG